MEAGTRVSRFHPHLMRRLIVSGVESIPWLVVAALYGAVWAVCWQ